MPLNLQDIQKITVLINKKVTSLLKARGTKEKITSSGEPSSYNLFEIQEELKKKDEALIEQGNKITKLENQLVLFNSGKTGEPSSNETALEEMVRQLIDRVVGLEGEIKLLGSGTLGVEYDLKREFDVFAKSTIQLDFVSKPITGEILNELFEKILREDNPLGFSDFKFPVRAIEIELTLEEWIIPGITKKVYPWKGGKKIDITDFWVNESGTMRVDNSFIPWNPNQGGKRISLGTGTGKSTHFLRCVAHAGRSVQELEDDKSISRGATLVVPYESLIDSVLGSHNGWLAKGKDKKKEKGKLVTDEKRRVTVCLVCHKSHTAQFNITGDELAPIIDDELEPVMYSVTKLNEEGEEVTTEKQLGKYEIVEFNRKNPDKVTCSSLINVFTLEDFSDVYDRNLKDDDGNSLIKPWVVFDEAHTDTLAYVNLTKRLKEKEKKGKLPFKILEMSATFGTHPTARKLAGKGKDLYVTDFTKLLKVYPDVFKNRSTIIFCDDPSRLNKNPKNPFKVLKSGKIKFIESSDQLKEAATELVEEIIKPPMIFVVNRDYSVGFSFGNVNVITTGVSQRIVIKGVDKEGKLIEEIVSGVSDYADLMQERGRKDREEDHDGFFMSLIPENKDYKGKLTYIDAAGNKQDDYAGVVFDSYFSADTPTSEQRANLQRLIKAYRKPKPFKDLDPKIGRDNFNRLLVFNLKKNLDGKLNPINLFHVQPSEKAKRKIGEYVFFNKLVQYYEEEDIEGLMILANKEMIKTIIEIGVRAKKYPWATTPEPEDDFVFPDELGVRTFGFPFQFRIRGRGFSIETVLNKSGEKIGLKFIFKPYVLDNAKKDFLSGKVETYIEIPPKSST